jgi:geranylgeranyl diphosphate synthase type II
MVAGQVADIESENKVCSGEMLDYIHINKTAALIIAAIRAGAQLGGANTKTLNDLTIYAENLGLAFQIADDILDVIGSEEEMGKKAGSDSANEKSTYPALYGLEASKQKLMELTDTAINALADYYDNAEFFVKLAQDLAVRGK